MCSDPFVYVFVFVLCSSNALIIIDHMCSSDQGHISVTMFVCVDVESDYSAYLKIVCKIKIYMYAFFFICIVTFIQFLFIFIGLFFSNTHQDLGKLFNLVPRQFTHIIFSQLSLLMVTNFLKI